MATISLYCQTSEALSLGCQICCAICHNVIVLSHLKHELIHRENSAQNQ